MSNIGRDWLFIDASQTVIEEKKNDQEREKERNGRQNTRRYIHKFILIFSRRINLKIIASFDR
jgi:hypothetical protein